MLIPLMIIAIVLLPVSLKVMKLTSWVHLLGLIIVFAFIILLMNFFHYFLFFIVIIGIFCYQMINSILHFSQEKRRRQLIFHYIGTKGDVLPSHLSGSIAKWLKTQNIQYSYHRKQFLTIMEKGIIIKIILDKKAIKNADIYTIDIIPPVLSKTPVPEQYENEISNIVRTSIQHFT
jgi:predicted membrane protein